MTPRARERRFRRIREIGCLACRAGAVMLGEAEVHHQNLGGLAGHPRLGDDHTIGLCAWHHRGVTPWGMAAEKLAAWAGPSLAREPRRFREVFGSDEELLAEQNLRIEQAERVARGLPA